MDIRKKGYWVKNYIDFKTYNDVLDSNAWEGKSKIYDEKTETET
jgi:hypothetical protein